MMLTSTSIGWGMIERQGTRKYLHVFPCEQHYLEEYWVFPYWINSVSQIITRLAILTTPVTKFMWSSNFYLISSYKEFNNNFRNLTYFFTLLFNVNPISSNTFIEVHLIDMTCNYELNCEGESFVVANCELSFCTRFCFNYFLTRNDKA